MAIDQEVAGGRVLVLAHAALDDWRVSKRRESAREPGAGDADAVLVEHAIGRVGIDVRAMLIDADLEAAAFEVGDAIDAGGKIYPRWCVRRPEPIVARGRAEVDHDLASGPDHPAEQIGKHCWQPGAAGEDEHVAVDRLAVGDADRPQRTIRRWDRHARAREPDAARDRVRGKGAHGTARHDHSALRLQQRRADVVGHEVRVARAQPDAIEHLQRILSALQRPPCGERVGIVAARQPQHAAFVKQRLAATRAEAELAPELERAQGKL